MIKVSELYQSADWKAEKHIPVIEAPAEVVAGEKITVRVLVGKEISHPNSLEHHIKSVKLYFKAEDSKFAVELCNLEFCAHGESALYTEPVAEILVKFSKSGTLMATAYCNIHGLWESSSDIVVKG